MKPHSRLVVGSLLALFSTCPSCCTMARLFCGPDKTPWVTVAHHTPQQTLATFLEAVRRDDPYRVYQCLAQSYVRAHDLDYTLVSAFWERLTDEVPAHMLGYAAVPERPWREQDSGVTYALLIEGQTLHIHMVCQTYWEIRYRDAAGEPQETSRTLDFATLNGLAEVRPLAPDDIDGTPRSAASITPIEFAHPRRPKLKLEDVDRIAVGREWKIADIAAPAK